MMRLTRLHVPLHPPMPAPHPGLGVPLLALELMALAALAAVVLAAWARVEPAQPVSAAPGPAAVRRYLDLWQPLTDPLVAVGDGLMAKSSNVDGFDMGGVRYYYRLLHGASYDPISTGRASTRTVVGVLDQETPWAVEIYRLP